MQQMILGQVSSVDQPQEEVQLTELLPVKQSRIRESNTFKDADATDALKALRSFSDGCEEDREFGLRAFDVAEGEWREEKQGGKQQRDVNSRKRNGAGRRISEDGVGVKEEKESRDRFSTDEAPKKRTRQDSKKGSPKARKKINGASLNRRESSESVRHRGNRKTDEKESEVLLDDDGSSSRDYDEEHEPTYLDLDPKNKDCLSDEIYVFRREPQDPRSTVNGEDTGSNPDDPEEIYDKDYHTTDGSLFDRTVHRNSKKLENEGTVVRGRIPPASKTKSKTNSESGSSSEKELRLKIDAIIQANFLLERENNNVVQQDQKKVQKDSSSAPLPTSTTTGSTSQKEVLKADKNSTEKPLEVSSSKDQDQQEQKVQKKYCCVVCDARFKGSGGLRNHYKVVHGAGPSFKCDECGKEFPLKERLKLHVRTHTGFKPYKCPECDKSFARGGQLVQHRRTHSQVKPYRCAICSGTFTCAANLALHVKRHNGQKDHKCEICGRGFVRRDALKKHLECLHRDVKSFLCVICNKTFKGHLPQHMRTHARDRPHGCATCGQRFAQKSQLTVHQRTHSGQRPFRCLVCWQAFAHSTALKLHTRRHTGERPFKCVECNAGFTQLPHWKKHMKCIHGRNEPYSCRRCKSFFRIKNDLEYHEKICHPDMEDSTIEKTSNSVGSGGVTLDGAGEKLVANTTKYRVMTVERMRLLLAVLLKRISRQERLDELGFGKRLIDEVLQDSLISAGKEPVARHGLSELESLTKNLEIFLEWTVPKEHWENFRKLKKTPEDILETLTT